MANKRKKTKFKAKSRKKGGSVNQKAVFLPFGKGQFEAKNQQTVFISL